jgi:hypothetical protein
MDYLNNEIVVTVNLNDQRRLAKSSHRVAQLGAFASEGL